MHFQTLHGALNRRHVSFKITFQLSGEFQTQCRTTGIKIGAISRTSPSSHPPTICVGPWGKFVHVSNVYVRMHVEVQALHYTWNAMYRVDFTSACCQEGLPLAIGNDCYNEYVLHIHTS